LPLRFSFKGGGGVFLKTDGNNLVFFKGFCLLGNEKENESGNGKGNECGNVKRNGKGRYGNGRGRLNGNGKGFGRAGEVIRASRKGW